MNENGCFVDHRLNAVVDVEATPTCGGLLAAVCMNVMCLVLHERPSVCTESAAR